MSMAEDCWFSSAAEVGTRRRGKPSAELPNAGLGCLATQGLGCYLATHGK